MGRCQSSLMSEQESRASLVLSGVIKGAGQPGLGSGLEIIDSWTEGELIVCVIYRSALTDGAHGLRREVETDIPVQAVVTDILWHDLSEPIGAEAASLTRDSEGILWWSGTRPEWRYQAMKARGH